MAWRVLTGIFLRMFNRSSSRGLALCTAGGFVFDLLHTPLPWMIGPLLVMAAAKLRGAKVEAPHGGRQTGQLLIACTLGLYFTPVVAAALKVHAFVVLLAAALAILVGTLCAFFLTRVSGVDKTTAFFASIAGGAAEMAVMAERYGAAVEKVAFAHSLRMLLVVVIVPTALTLFGAHGADQYQPISVNVNYLGLALMLLLCVAGAVVLSGLNIFNAWLLGPLLVTIALTVTETGLSAMPTELSNLGQLLVGCALGARFKRGFLKGSSRYLFGVVASIGIALVLSALSGVALAYIGGVAVPTMILATAPGGVGEMGITAKVLQLGVPLVTAAHLTRVLLIVTTTAPLFNLARYARTKFRKKGSGKE